MAQLGSILFYLVLAMVLFLAVFAIIRGYKGLKTGKNFETSDKKIRFVYALLSVIHMSTGILITLCYLIAGVLIIISL
ncbi:hypothetical protein [Clostridium sp. BNL1100]|uniref:hypothetical protein n=1 Tax=Clostridium sp. BNL1100 TaxID=755731 RepID=UPI00024A749E|nr:hypothetical protein [Clostridium sp. BNL1100]AEY65130.1 hypothetical protein Clo1100_0873 [Clostridium sp. BNL1100]